MHRPGFRARSWPTRSCHPMQGRGSRRRCGETRPELSARRRPALFGPATNGPLCRLPNRRTDGPRLYSTKGIMRVCRRRVGGSGHEGEPTRQLYRDRRREDRAAVPVLPQASGAQIDRTRRKVFESRRSPLPMRLRIQAGDTGLTSLLSAAEDELVAQRDATRERDRSAV